LTVSHAFVVGHDCSTAIAHYPQKHGTRKPVIAMPPCRWLTQYEAQKKKEKAHAD